MIILITLIIVFFPVGLVIKKKFPNLCALCFATTSAWVLGLLYMPESGSVLGTVDSLSLGIFMGGSAVGSMYYLSARFKNDKDIFKLPYLITLFYASYVLLQQEIVAPLLIGIGIVWFIFIALYALRGSPRLKDSITKIINCCKNW